MRADRAVVELFLLYLVLISKPSRKCKKSVMNSSKYGKSPGRHPEGTLGVRFNHAAFKKHGMVFHLQPWFDKVCIVLAGNLARLSGSMARERSLHICQVHNLAI